MEKKLKQAEMENNNPKVAPGENSRMPHENEKITSDKISENRNIGGLTDRDDAPGSGFSVSDPAEHTLGNP